MSSHVSQCMAKACMCVTHGMPCVTMHGLYEGYIYGSQIQFGRRGQQLQSVGAARRRRMGKREGGGKEKRKGGKGRRKRGKERRKERRKEKRKGEEERKKKEEEEGVLRSEMTQTTKNPELRYKR